MRSVLSPYTGWHPCIPLRQSTKYAHTYVQCTELMQFDSFSSVSYLSEDVGSVLVRALTLSLQLPSLVPYSDSGLLGTRQGPLQVCVGPMWHNRADRDLNLAHRLRANMSTLATLMAAILSSVATQLDILLLRVK